MSIFMMNLMRSDNRFADAFARYDSGGASGSGGSRARDSEGGEDGDDTGGEDGGDDTKVSPATRWGIYCHRDTNSLTKKYVEPTFRWGLSLGNVLPSSLPHQLFPSDISLGIDFPSDMSLTKGSECSEGGTIHPGGCFICTIHEEAKRLCKKNKAKPEGSIAEGYVAEEALTLSSYYFRDVTMKFNRLERNVDPPPNVSVSGVPVDLVAVTRQKPISKTPRGLANITSELFALANGPSRTPMSVNACVVDGVRYVVQSRDERRTTQNSGICAPGPDGEMSYGQLQEILEFKYLSFKVALFRVKWFDTRNNGRVKGLKGISP
ncbi:S-adenosyl-L-methionine-dependent methyltransferases superfamily protein [Tanacetum coccineum]